MAALKLCSGAEAVRKFVRAGWTATRQKGSHVMMTKPGYQYTLSIPQHQELGPGLLRKLLRQAEITTTRFTCFQNRMSQVKMRPRSFAVGEHREVEIRVLTQD